jgi:hypothetical protein
MSCEMDYVLEIGDFYADVIKYDVYTGGPL